MPPPSTPRVSVIVPVFEPGPEFDELIASLDQQTRDTDEFEVLLCDDGSGESTRHRLERVARSRPNVRVLTLAHTGWPGTPRNHGIDEARGRYLFFADQDDRLFAGALESMCDYADELGSDVVVGKVVGIDGRRIPQRIFQRDITHAVLGDDPLLELLTPHKLFRTSFVRREAIRFPDGRVRLEDHLFVMQAYFRATRISILSSRPCYAWRKNHGSASSSRIDPETYFPHLERVLALVEDNTEPGPLRETMLRHWYRGKILKRLEGRRLLRQPDDYRVRFLDVVEPLVRRWFPPNTDAGLTFPHRVRSALLRAGRRGDLVSLAEFEVGLRCSATLVGGTWLDDGTLELRMHVEAVDASGDALVFAQIGGRELWRPPPPIEASGLGDEVLDATRDLRVSSATLHLSDRAGRIAGPAARGGRSAGFVVRPLNVFPRGSRSPGGVLSVRVRHVGWELTAGVLADRDVVDGFPASPLRAGRRMHLETGPGGKVSLVREAGRGAVRDYLARAIRRVRALAPRHPAQS
ncbi:glycosyltransferase [Microbacterium sp.]|uniref:glycosyltransferase family 2 protein n=1 Tax=Microbacterium sp. TaxID=51671 RepID=UPI003F6F2224